ncbi:MAG: hypothetical protein IT374_14490 [Polyangiaceae bacterium]|nr:hypothetical protein [Polyangiaceae bacterium]
MAARTLHFSLDAVRTDGWFERIGEDIGSFAALCDIVGERFVAFSLITGARITALSVDRRNLEASLVDFVVGGDGGDGDVEPQRLTLGEFRRRLVMALLAEDEAAPAPTRESDAEALQLHIGVRFLLLAPIYGYELRSLDVEGQASLLTATRDGEEEQHVLESFRSRLRAHVREELDRAASGANRGVIDLSRVAEAEAAAERGDHARVRQVLGAWPAPLAIYLRTPDGQMLAPEARATIARGLALLASSCGKLGDPESGDEIFRLAVQYAQDGAMAAEVFRRLGESLLSQARPGEAVAALRRAINLGAKGDRVWPELARAFVERGRYVAALACVKEARAAGAPAAALAEPIRAVEAALGPLVANFEAHVAAR